MGSGWYESVLFEMLKEFYCKNGGHTYNRKSENKGIYWSGSKLMLSSLGMVWQLHLWKENIAFIWVVILGIFGTI